MHNMKTNVSLTEWMIPKVKYGLNDEKIWIEYLADPNVNDSENQESSVKRRARAIREILNKYEMLIAEDFDRATRLVSRVEKGLELEMAIKSYDIRDVEGLRDWANLDSEEWDCISQTVRASQNKTTPWFIAEGKFKKKDIKNITTEELIKKYKYVIEEYIPKQIIPHNVKRGTKLLVISLPDLHMGDMSYDNKDSLEKCSKRFLDAVTYFITETANLDEIMITFGSDFFTLNADKPETTKGTVQDTTNFYNEIYEVGLKTAVDAVTFLRGYAPKVNVVGVVGNHDEQSSVWLMLALNQIFKNVDGVNIDYKYDMRKYYRFGSTAFTLVHKLQKNLLKLPLLMYQEMIDRGLIDSGVKYYEILGGHLHQPGKFDMPAETTNQKITQRVLSSLSTSSRYSKDNYGDKLTEGQGFLYDCDKGITNCLIFRP